MPHIPVTDPAPIGNEYKTITLIQGQTTYNSATHQVIAAQTLRLNTVKAAQAVGLSVSGTYEGRVRVAGANGSTSVTISWYAAGSSTETNVANLSAEYLRIEATGN